jgi:PAS domain S-box-containing protein
MSGAPALIRPTVSLASISITQDLGRRPAHPRDPGDEAAAQSRIFRALGESAAMAYRAVVDAALHLCTAGSSGISLLHHEDGQTRVYWPALAGAVAEQLRGTVPVECIPCSTALANNTVVLLREPARHFTVLAGLNPPVLEALVSPVRVDGVPIGTLWAMAHDPERQFDAEDARLLESLSIAAAAAYRHDRAERVYAEADVARRTLDALMDHLPEGITIADAPDVTIRRVSRFGQQLTGRPLAQIAGIPADLHPQNWEICFPEGGLVPADRLPLTRATTQGEIVRNEELVLRRPDGQAISILCNAGPIRAATGEITGGLIAWRDIDDYKQAKQLAVESQRRLDAVLDNTTAAIFLMDDRQHCIYMNAAAERLTGYTLTEAQGRPLHDVVHHTRPDGRHFPIDECPIDRAFPQNMREQGEEIFVHKDGTFYPVAFTASPIRHSERTVGTVIEVRDLRSEREADTRVRLALRAARAGAWTWDLQTGALDWSPEIFEMHGLSPAQGTPTLEVWQRSLVPDDNERLWRYMTSLLASTARDLRVEFRIRTPSGERWLLAVGEVARDATGGAVRVSGLNLDITQEKATALALEASERALREADRRKDEFLATLSHELRNPLAPVRTAVRVLNTPEATPEQHQWSREVIDRQVTTMARLLDDLLDAARITSGKLEIRRESVQVWSVLANAVETSRPWIEARNHKLVVVLPEDPVRLDADPIRLCQIVANLLNNAAKYTPPGGQIELVASADATHVRIEVHDSGVGLPPDALARVFDMFAQVDGSREQADGGLGIGLALVKGLVELHGGTVEVHSDGQGRGSTFAVVLPRAADRSSDAARSGGPHAPSGERTVRRVLIADDNRDSADSLAMLLGLEGHQVRVAYSGDQALAVVQEFAPDVALLDIGMPGLTGYEVAQRIRGMTIARRPTLVAITGWGQDSDKHLATAAGFDGHLTKPVDPDSIAALLRGSK